MDRVLFGVDPAAAPLLVQEGKDIGQVPFSYSSNRIVGMVPNAIALSVWWALVGNNTYREAFGLLLL